MRLDKFSNPIFDQQDIFKILYQGRDDVLAELIVDCDNEITRLEAISEIKFQKYNIESETVSIEDFDSELQSDWFMPDEFKELDIEDWLMSVCPAENLQRLTEELNEYRSRNMINLLRWLRYFVELCEKEEIVWGVGRGSSVASYVLFLIGIHMVDPIKYNLDWREFLR